MTARIIMKLHVVERLDETDAVAVITLRHPTRTHLPAWSAGAHVDLRLPDGKVRQYSLCGDPGDLTTYRIAVKREDDGRGASSWIHKNLVAGATAHVSAPRSNFGLVPNAAKHIFIAGGIGVTPLLPMAREASRRGQDFVFHYCARSQASAPLLKELRDICGPRLHTYFAEERRIDVGAVMGAIAQDDSTEIYCCGPQRLTDALREVNQAIGRSEARLHFEIFQPTADENFKPEPFDLMIANTGETLRVPADRSALDVLRERGFVVPSSCELGVCGSCICHYTDGAVIHRDSVLSLADRQSRMALCVSRARGAVTLNL